MKPISIVVTSFNQRKYLKEALDSVLNQTVKPREIIVCDDYSTDGSREMLKRYDKKYDNIDLIFQDENVGVAKNRNSGLKYASSPFISILDGDDFYSKNKLESEYNAIKDSKYGWAYSEAYQVSKDFYFGQVIINEENGKTGDIFFELLTKEVSPKHWMMRKEALENVGYLDEDLALQEDWELKIRLSHDYKAVFCPDSRVYYRNHSDGLHYSSDFEKQKQKKIIYDKVLNKKIDQLPRVKNNKKKIKKILHRDFVRVAGFGAR